MANYEQPPLLPSAARRQFRALLHGFARLWHEAKADADETSLWHPYAALLDACQDILASAPMHPNEVKQCNVERRFELAVERLATTLYTIMPGKFIELRSYVVTDLDRERRRRRAAFARFQRMQRQRARRRKAGESK